MLLIYLLVTLVSFGSSLYISEDKCYGSSYRIPASPLSGVEIMYTPKEGEQRVVVQNRKSLDPRFKVSHGSIEMKDLTEQDDGALLFFKEPFAYHVKLKISDCGKSETRYYGSLFSWEILKGAEYLEFSQTTPWGILQPIILWNHTEPTGSRGTVISNYYEIYDLTQKDSGYYKLRGSNNRLLKWRKLIVREYTRNLESEEGTHLLMEYPLRIFPWQVKFTPMGTDNTHTLGDEEGIHDRVQITDKYFSIDDVKVEDAGLYEFIDDQDNLILRLEVEVMEAGPVNDPEWMHIVFPVGIVFGVILCCCCVKKCCCKKSSNKRNSPDPQTEAAAPAVYYHDTTQPTCPPAPTSSYQPVNPTAPTYSPEPPTYDSVMADMSPPPFKQPVNIPAPGESTVTNPEPPAYHSVMADMTPQVSAPEVLGATSSTSATNDFTSDSEPNFL